MIMLKKIFELLMNFVDTPTQFIIFFMLIWTVPVVIIYGFKKIKNKWLCRLLAMLPLVVWCVFYLINYSKGNYNFALVRYIPQLFIAILFTLVGLLNKFIKNRKTAFISLSIFSFLAFSTSLLYILGLEGTTNFQNNSHLGYEASIKSTIDDIEKNYQLGDYKEIDFDKLREEYIPRAKIAEENNDKIAFGEIVAELCYEFHDGHFYYTTNDGELKSELTNKLCGNDYGFSMIQLDNGSVIVTMLDENSEAKEKGLYNGAVITKWNGVSINDALSSVKCVSPTWPYEDFPCIDNENTVRAIYLAGRGENSIEVSFFDKSEKENTITVKSQGSYASKLFSATSPFFNRKTEEFAYTKMLDDNCGYIVIPRERYDTYGDIYASLKDEYPKIKELYINKIEDLRNQGMKQLIVDIRGNAGGFDVIYEEFVSLFTKKDVARYIGFYEGDNSFELSKNYIFNIKADGRYADIPVVVLVNAGCGSSGDLLAYNLSFCPNVTIMGMTTSWGSAQSAGGVCLLSNSEIEIHFPVTPTMNEDGSVCMDAGKDRKNPLKLDVKIPLTEEVINNLYYENKDYELEYALSYINNH